MNALPPEKLSDFFQREIDREIQRLMATGMTRTQAAKILSSALNCVNARTAESLDPAFR
jgi:uncharacterized protein YoaH (UPF0181 family)